MSKIMKSILLPLLISAVIFTGCDALNSVTQASRTASQGAPYEVVTVCVQPLWEGEFGDSLRMIMRAPDPYLNSEESIFSLFQVTPANLTKLVEDHRNRIMVDVDKRFQSAGSKVEYDKTASPQMVLTLMAPSQRALTEYISENREVLVQLFEKAERDRAVAYAEKYGEKRISSEIKRTFGVEMDVPKGYVLAKHTDNFMWLRYEYPSASQGFMLYSYPYEGKMSLSEGELYAKRLEFAAEIPGPSDGSYMPTSSVFPPVYRLVKIGDRVWAEMRGFWDVENDFMGGPYVSYSTVDKATKRVFTIDCYIYSPKLDKRNFMRGVEHLVYMIHFPEDSAPVEESL